MYAIKKTLVDDFVDYFKKKGGKYRYFADLPNCSIRSLKDINFAITNVFNSGVPFQTGRQKYKDHVSSGYLGLISKKIYDYFNAGHKAGGAGMKKVFDELHEELCELFLSEAKKLGKTYTYGNAQKLINMTFKYLTCFKDYPVFASLFDYCHTPIDSIILEQFEAVGVPNIDKTGPTYKYSFGGACYSWTQLEKKAYLSLVDGYRNKIGSTDPNCSALYFDFYNWAPKGIKKTPIIP